MVSRNHGSSKYGTPFNLSVIQAVWDKGRTIPGENPDMYRTDIYGTIIMRSEYGNTDAKYGLGWEIDHIQPVAHGGDDDLTNLQPLQWHNNRDKSDGIKADNPIPAQQQYRTFR